MLTTVLAICAATWGVIMALSPLLQMRRIMRQKSSRDVSIGYFAVLLIGFGLWLGYGVAIANAALIIPNAVAFCVACLPSHWLCGIDLVSLLRPKPMGGPNGLDPGPSWPVPYPWGDHGTAEVFLFRPGRLTTVLDLRFEGRYCRFTDGPIPTVDPTGPGGTRWGQRGPPRDRRAPQRGVRFGTPLRFRPAAGK